MRKPFLLAVLFALLFVWYGEVEAALAPVHCHRYSTWLYPWRQTCPLSYRRGFHRVETAKRMEPNLRRAPPATPVARPRTPFDLIQESPTPAWVKAANELKL
jgi:hypothetical protein